MVGVVVCLTPSQRRRKDGCRIVSRWQLNQPAPPLERSMKQILLTTIAAVVLVGCGPKAPDISIIDAAKQGNIEAVKQHIAAGTDVNAKDEDGYTPLHVAAWEGHKEIAELLIAKGADVNAIIVSGRKQGKTPLDVAIEFKHTETADLLRKHGGKTGEELEAAGN